MHLSYLLVNTGDNPDRPRPGRSWLRNVYRVHQRLCMAFPDRDRRANDPQFLDPFVPKDFPLTGPQVHVSRESRRGFLFRIDPQPGGSPIITVLSNMPDPPDWSYAFNNAAYLLAAEVHCRPYNPTFTTGQRLRFRLQANAVRRISQHSRDHEGNVFDAKWQGKLYGIDSRPESAERWLAVRTGAGQLGFAVEKLDTILPGYLSFNARRFGRKQTTAAQSSSHEAVESDPIEAEALTASAAPADQPRAPNEHSARLRSVRYEGVLTVTDPALLLSTVARGIGPGKAFGFGLLSLAPA